MAAFDFDSFLRQLAAFMAAAASIEFSSTPRALWCYELVEIDSTLEADTPSPASVLRIWDGSLGFVPVPSVKIQCQTTALPGDDASGMTRAQALHGTLLDAAGRPLRMKTGGALTNFRINGIRELQAPAQIGRDEKGRALIVFNFSASFVKTS